MKKLIAGVFLTMAIVSTALYADDKTKKEEKCAKTEAGCCKKGEAATSCCTKKSTDTKTAASKETTTKEATTTKENTTKEAAKKES